MSNPRFEIGKIWLGLAEMYGKEISTNALTIMLNAIEDLDTEKVIIALNNWARTSKQTRYPLPSEIREIVNPILSTDALAKESSARIQQAISKFGYMQPNLAKEFIGEIGWNVVERFGGWVYICENHGVDLNPLTFLAQARDLAKAQIELGQNKLNGAAPMLSHAGISNAVDSRNSGLEKASDILTAQSLLTKAN